jgi:hypothetical protein
LHDQFSENELASDQRSLSGIHLIILCWMRSHRARRVGDLARSNAECDRQIG